MNGDVIIDLKNIYKRFYIGEPNELEILHGIDLTVREGEFVSIVGASGSGKSTLMNIIGALDRPTEGSYDLNGTNVCAAPDSELSHIRNKQKFRTEKCGTSHDVCSDKQQRTQKKSKGTSRHGRHGSENGSHSR